MASKGLRLSFLLWLTLFACPAVAADLAPEKTRFDYALRLYVQGAYDSAVREFADYLRDYPKGEYSDDAGYWLGKYYQMAGNYEEAFGQFRAIVSLLPSSDKAPAAQYEIANYYFDPANPKHDYEKAIAEYLKIPYFYPESPTVPEAAYYAAVCQIKLGNYRKAEGELRAFVEKYPGSELAPPALFKQGMAAVLQGKADEALGSFQAVRDRYPAGLYARDALDAAELIVRARDKRPLSVEYTSGSKGSAPGMLSRPYDAALDREGGLYVSDTGNARIQRFKAAAGTLTVDLPSLAPQTLDKALQPVRPAGLAIGPKGLVYVTDPSLHRAQVFQPDGKLLLTIGKKGVEPGDLNTPSGVAVDEGGNIYVADTGNRRVEKFDRDGRFAKFIGNSGVSEENLLKAPVGVAIDVEGNLLVTDGSAGRIYKYDQAGKVLAMFMSRHDSQFKLGDPAGIGVDTVGNVYVIDRDKPSILVLGRDLRPLMEFSGQGGRRVFDNPTGLAVAGNGELFVADQGLNQIVVVK